MLKLYQSNRLEYLADLLARVISEPLANPFTPERVVVQHPGMGRWLSLQLAQQLGVCANFHFSLPAGFIWEMLRSLLDELPEQDRFAPAVSQWRIFELLQQHAGEPAFKPVRHYLDASDEPGRLELAERIAFCFDQYLVYRPDWIRRWERGEQAREGDEWQAELWRRLGASLPGDHWVDLQRRLYARLEREAPAADSLPARVTLFGIPTLSPGYLEIIRRLSQWMDIHLFLLNPCEAHWTEIVTPDRKAGEEESEGLYLEVGNPLLASLGRQGRDFFASLLALDPGTIDLFAPPEGENLLQHIQGDILQLNDGTLETGRRMRAGDDSLQFHSCHSPMREVEVLRDQLLDLFQRHPRLQPEDILVMTPDMDLYAPYIEAVFAAESMEKRIPFGLADRNLTAESPLAGSFLGLLESIDSRYEVGLLLSLLEVPAIQRRFGIGEGDLPLITRWVKESGIRWGRDGGTRSALRLPETDQNSWQAGLDRLLLGFALPAGDDRLFRGVLSQDQVEGSDAALLGALHSYAQALFSLRTQLAGRCTLSRWGERLAGVIDRFFAPQGEEESQLQLLRDLIASMQEQAALAGFNGEVSLDLIRSRMASQLDATGGERGFLGGGVTFCALTPMRSLPFQVICLIGMNDGAFPRDQRPPGFDLMADNFRPGDRPRRADDRYLFLETLLSARGNLYISYTGRDSRDNAPLPPSVLVSELLDYVESAFVAVDGGTLVGQFPRQHPLQAFNPDYFRPGDALFSYSTVRAKAARALLEPSLPVPNLVPERLPEPEDEWRRLDLDQLVSFFANPTRYLLRQRLGILLELAEEEPESREPFGLEYFESNRLGRRLVESALSGRPAGEILQLERAAGSLPHGVAGERLFVGIQEQAEPFAQEIRAMNVEAGEPLDVAFQASGLRLSGRLPRVGSQGITGYCVERLPATLLTGLWVRHLALNVAAPEGILAQTRWLDADGMIHLPAVPEAADLLAGLLALYWQGLSTPLHLFPKSSREYVTCRRQGKSQDQSLARAWGRWNGGFQDYPEFGNAYYRLAFPQGDVLDSEFERLSEQFFEPLLSALEGD